MVLKSLIRYSILLIYLCVGLGGVYAQTNTGYEDKLVLFEERNFVLCNAEGKQFLTSLENHSTNDFKDGTFEVDMGDGNPDHVYKGLTKEDFPLDIAYTKKGPFELRFSARTLTGLTVTNVYHVTTLGRPEVSIIPKIKDVQCVGNDVIYIIDVYDRNSAATVYTVTFDDGSEPVVLTNEQLKAKQGEVTHKFDHSYCGDEFSGDKGYFEVKVEAVNECPLRNSASIEENVVVPIHAAFTFDQFDGRNCTYEPVRLKNLTSGGTNVDCTPTKIYYKWDFGNGKTSTKFEPEITYEEAKDYHITLKVSNDFTCAKDSATVSMMVIPRVVANFEMDDDTICAGTVLTFRNRTQGGELQPFVWSIVSLDGFPSPEITNGGSSVGSPKVRFDHYGRFRVTLSARNGCTDDVKDTVIVVRQDPDIRKFDLPESVCPPRFDLAGKVAYAWNGNEAKPKWTVTDKATGHVQTDIYAEGTSAASEFPVWNITAPGLYHVKLELTGVGCGGTTLVKEGDFRVYDPDIGLQVTTTPLEVCENAQISFTSTSTGDNLVHNWSYAPASNVEFLPGKDTHSKDPVLSFKKYGSYTVSLHLDGACGTKDSVFDVHVKKEPNIFYFDLPAAICPDEVIRFNEKIIYQFNGNAEEARWTITPATGFEFLEGTDYSSPYPVIRFFEPAVNYKIGVKIKPVGCTMDGVTQEAEKQMRVRASAMKLKAAATDTVVCEGEKIDFSMSATSDEGDPLIFNWSITLPDGTIPADGYFDYGFIGNQSQVANITFNHWGSYLVRGEASGFCGNLDSMILVRIKKDPEVRLKDTTGICPGILDMADYVTYEWFANPAEAVWTITPSGGTPVDGYEFAEGDAASLYPKVNFKSQGIYDILVKLKTVDCAGGYQEARRQYEIYDTTITVDMGPDLTDICEGDKVRIRNVNLGVGLRHHWTVSGAEDGWEYAEGTGEDSPAPVFSFTKYGEYELHVDIEGTCNRKERTFKITVRGVPDISLRPLMPKTCAGMDTIDMADYLQYTDEKNSTLAYEWQITPATGFTYAEGFGGDRAFPRIIFEDNNHYTVGLTVKSQCAVPDQEFSSEIDIIKAGLKAAFTIPEEGCVTDLHILPVNSSDGDSLSWQWEIQPQEGWTLQPGSSLTDKVPEVIITGQGNYTFTLNVSNICGTDPATAEIRTYAVPTVTFGDISGVCETYTLKTADTVHVTVNNDALRHAKWTVAPAAGFADGDTEESLFPELVFNHGSYEVKAQFWNGCADPGVAEFTVAVDEFIPVAAISNDTLCHLEPVLPLAALPDGGIWTLPGDTDLLKDDAGSPVFDPQRPGEYELLYTFTNKSCTSTNTKKIKVHALPVVEAGEEMAMCLNEDPRTLAGLPASGWWEGDGVVSPVFTPVADGEVTLRYYYKDEHRCTNYDSVVMRVHPLPDTAFVSKDQYCRGIGAEFQPAAGAKEYIWDWNDGSNKETTTGDGIHVYERPGYYEVQLVAVSEFNCMDTSDVRRIEIVNDAPKAAFALDKHVECGPDVDVHITVKPEDYADHNLHFSWDFGNGNTSEALLPENPQTYHSGLFDTTYRITFRVWNICNATDSVDYVTVGSVPQAGLTFQHEWNCSPLTLRVKNTSTGNGNAYTWYMGDGTVFPNVYEPEDHLYKAPDGTKVFDVSLVAENNCGKDSVSKALTVLAGSLEAFFKTPKKDICVGEEICFTNSTTDTSLYVSYKYWDFGDEVRDTSWHACHVYADSGWYKVLLYVDNGCGFDTISDRVHVWALPQLGINSGETVCDRDSFAFSFTADQKLQQWKWELGDGTESLERQFTHRYPQPGDYTVNLEVMAENIAFCKATDQKTVTVHPRPVLQFAPLDTLVCPPFTFLPRVTGEAAVLTWDYGDGSALTSSLEHVYENTTDSVEHHQVTLHAESEKGCREDFTGSITVADLPVAEMRKVVTQGRPQKVELINGSREFSECIWYLPEGRVDYTFDDRHLEFMENGHQVFSLVAYNEYGCRDSVALEHEVLIKGLYFPNTFIPHSLNGKVNRFNGIGMGLQSYKLEIYDGHNNKIWETRALQDGKPSEGWDGCNVKGERMPQGTYIWRAEAIFKDAGVWTGDNNESGVPQTVQGIVLLLRE